MLLTLQSLQSLKLLLQNWPTLHDTQLHELRLPWCAFVGTTTAIIDNFYVSFWCININKYKLFLLYIALENDGSPESL